MSERMPAEETPLERVERDIAWLKRLPDIVVGVLDPVPPIRLGPWERLDEYTKRQVLNLLDWRGVGPEDNQRIMEREVDCSRFPTDPFYPFTHGKNRPAVQAAPPPISPGGQRRGPRRRSRAAPALRAVRWA
jgi:hypothetical protein